MSVKGIQKCVLSTRGMGVIASNRRFVVGWLQVGTLPITTAFWAFGVREVRSNHDLCSDPSLQDSHHHKVGPKASYISRLVGV